MKRLVVGFSLVLALLSPVQSWAAAPTFDAASSAGTIPVLGVLTFAHTVGATADGMYLCFGYRSSSGPIVSVTWNGSATGVSVVTTNIPGGGDPAIELWKVIAPATGTHNVVAAITDTGLSGYFIGGAVSLIGTHQTTPVTASATAVDTTGSSAALTVTVASNTGEMVVGCGTQDAVNTYTSTGTAQTERMDGNDGTNSITTATQTGATSTVHSYTASAAKEWATGAMSVAGAAGGGGGANVSRLFQRRTQ